MTILVTNSTYTCPNTDREYVFDSTRVVLVDGDFDPGADDPFVDTEYECEGIVVGYGGEEYPIKVEWDNGCVNEYHPDHLEIIGHIEKAPPMLKDNPNRTFKQRRLAKDTRTIEVGTLAEWGKIAHKAFMAQSKTIPEAEVISEPKVHSNSIIIEEASSKPKKTFMDEVIITAKDMRKARKSSE